MSRYEHSSIAELTARAGLLDAACAYEAAEAEAHYRGYHMGGRARLACEQVTDALTALAIDSDALRGFGEDALLTRIEGAEDAFGELASQLETVAEVKLIPSSRRRFIAAQAARFRELATGGYPQHYAGVPRLHGPLRKLLAERATDAAENAAQLEAEFLSAATQPPPPPASEESL